MPLSAVKHDGCRHREGIVSSGRRYSGAQVIIRAAEAAFTKASLAVSGEVDATRPMVSIACNRP